jgi:hypothetical protein
MGPVAPCCAVSSCEPCSIVLAQRSQPISHCPVCSSPQVVLWRHWRARAVAEDDSSSVFGFVRSAGRTTAPIEPAHPTPHMRRHRQAVRLIFMRDWVMSTFFSVLCRPRLPQQPATNFRVVPFRGGPFVKLLGAHRLRHESKHEDRRRGGQCGVW